MTSAPTNPVVDAVARYEVNFAPVRRFIAGEHQPDIGYILNAASLDEAKTQAVIWLRAEHRGLYRFQSARQVQA